MTSEAPGRVRIDDFAAPRFSPQAELFRAAVASRAALRGYAERFGVQGE